MRFLKKLLVCVYFYLALFITAALVIFAVTGVEPTTLITCVVGVAGIESMLGAIIKTAEVKKETKTEENNNGAVTCKS